MATIGEIQNKLGQHAIDIPLTWSEDDEKGFRIKDVCSYRGYYDQAALVVEIVDIELADNVSHLNKCLNELLENEFSGYKGGVYTYGKDTDLYLVSDSSYTDFRGKHRTIKVKEDGTFKDKKVDW